MVPPSQYQPNYAQLYTLDADAGFDVRLRQLLAATTKGSTRDPNDDQDNGSDDGEDDHRPAPPSRLEPIEQRRMRRVLPCINATLYANPLAIQYKRAFDEAPHAPMARLKLHVEPGQIPPGGSAAGAHQRQYNAPTADNTNVAVILHAPSDDSQLDRIVPPHLDEASNRLQRVPYSHQLFDALAFPLYLQGYADVAQGLQDNQQGWQQARDHDDGVLREHALRATLGCRDAHSAARREALRRWPCADDRE